MNVVEHRLNEILSRQGDVAAEVLRMCEDLTTEESVSLTPQLQNELRERLSTNQLEEEVWESLLSIMSPNEVSEDVLHYLIQNHILCFASVEMGDIVKNLFLLQENLILGLLCQTASSI